MGLQKFISGFREKRRQHRTRKAAAHIRELEVLDAIEHVVDEINPKIRALGGYRKKLRPCVEHTLDYCADLVACLPESTETSSKSWGREPLVKAFFSTAGTVQQVFSHNREVRDFFDRHTDATHCHALLSMARQERTVLGMEIQGEVIRRDVRQTAVSFTDHRVFTPSLNEPELKNNLRRRAFESLIACTLERISKLVAARHLLEEQQQLLNMQIKVKQLKGKSLEPLIGNRNSASIDIAALREQAANNGQAGARLTTLEDYIDRIADVLCNPESWLKLYSVSVHLSKMNIKLDDQSTDSGYTLQLTEAALGEHLKRTLLIARFPRDELLPERDFLA
ncbi:MAG: hypothetical protein ACE5FQ_03210 [Thiogranum sp.]